MSIPMTTLGLLNYMDSTGYGIKSLHDRFKSLLPTADISRFYRHLDKLEEAGYVTFRTETQQGRPDKNVYTITERGNEHFQESLNRYNDDPDTLPVKLFFGSQIPDDELEFQLKTYIRKKTAISQSFNEVNKELEKLAADIERPQEMFYWRLCLKKSHLENEASLRWAEESLEEIQARRLPNTGGEQ